MNETAREALAEYNRARAAGEIEPPVTRNPWQRWQDQNTRKTATAAFCWQCMGGTETEAKGVMASIRECSCEKTCSLWEWRPYK